MSMSFSCLYSFVHPEIELCEIKRLDQPADAPLSEIYHWLVLHKASGKVLPLDFVSMERTPHERREFVAAKLSFDALSAQLSILGREFSLVSEALKDTSWIRTYFAQKSPQGMRPLRVSDREQFLSWLKDEEVIRYSATRFHEMHEDKTRTEWFWGILTNGKILQWGILDESGRLIGYAGIAGINSVDKNGEYFILIGEKSQWGKGHATRITQAVVEAGFAQLKLHRIFLTAGAENPGAVKAYERAGFVHEGVLKDAFYRQGKFSDKIVMGMIRYV
jgi:RimJ/RimL family protein N-acetyltransferase